MDPTDAARLTAAIERVERDENIEPFLAMMTPDMRWTGTRSGWPWRRFTPG